MFQYEGRKYWLSIDEEDEEYIRILFQVKWEFESDEEKVKSLKVSNSINSEYKLGKISIDIDENIVEVDLSLLLAKRDDFKIFFSRCLGTIQHMMADFAEKMEE